MNRREFTTTTVLGALGIGFAGKISAAARTPQIAITMDDFNWNANPMKLNGPERNRAILDALRSNSLKAALFVRGSNIDNDEGKKLLKAWDDEGHLIGNHTYSHFYLNNPKISAESFEQDILRCENLLRPFPHFQRIFRFPYLKEGETAEKRDAIREFLTRQQYSVGHVTIDTSDWIIDERLRKRLAKDSSADLNPYRKFYLDHMWDRALYYDDLSQKVTGRSVKHTILMHFNLLNALFLGDLISFFKTKGWLVLDSVTAFTDPVFKAKPRTVPAGESIIWALAKETGRFDKSLRYPGEDGDYETAKMDKLGL